MIHRPSREHVRRLALGLSVALIAGVVALPALADDAPKTYTADVTHNGGDGSGVCAGAPTEFTLTLTNTSNQQQLGSANITPGFEVSDVAIDRAGSTNVADDTIELRDLGLAPDESLDVTFTGAPTVGDYEFDIVAKQANNFQGDPGNDLTLVGDLPSVTVTTCTLAFTTQPGTSQVTKPITGPPTVQIVDGDDEPLPKEGVSITMTVLPEGAAEPSGTSRVDTDEHGTATFSDLAIDTTGLGYQLVATAADFEDATSETFNVFDELCTAGTCSATAGGLRNNGNLLASASGTAPEAGAGLTVSVDALLESDDANGCSVPEGVELSSLPNQVTVVAIGLEDKTVEIRVDKSFDQQQTNNGVSFYQICAEPIEPETEFSGFTDRYSGAEVTIGGEGDSQPAGWLPDCSDSDDAPCVVSRVKRGGDPVITVRWGSGFRFR